MFRCSHRSWLARLGSQAALLALAVHLLLSFAHVHHQPAETTSGGCAVGVATSSCPAPVDDGTTAENDCAICANLAAFASLDLPPPVVDRPVSAVPAAFVASAQSHVAKRGDYHFFHTRAPPST